MHISQRFSFSLLVVVLFALIDNCYGAAGAKKREEKNDQKKLEVSEFVLKNAFARCFSGASSSEKRAHNILTVLRKNFGIQDRVILQACCLYQTIISDDINYHYFKTNGACRDLHVVESDRLNLLKSKMNKIKNFSLIEKNQIFELVTVMFKDYDCGWSFDQTIISTMIKSLSPLSARPSPYSLDSFLEYIQTKIDCYLS